MKKIYLLTRNRFKYREYKQFFSHYNIKVVMVDDFTHFRNVQSLMAQFAHLLDDTQAVNMLFDETSVYRESNHTRVHKVNAHCDGELVYATTTLYYMKGGKMALLASKRHKGIIDYSAKSHDKKLFGWDDVFVLRPLGLSYQELKERGLKNHSRQEVLSEFAIENLYYDQNIALNFNPLKQKQVVEFSSAIFDFVAQNPWINSPTVKEMQLDKLFDYALGNGGFFRSSRNRRQKNYWAPGLNAGIPLVPKKDEIHEITFFVHDLGHFVLPDLIYSGENHPVYDRVYTIYRMLSEAFTLVIADMLFIDALVRDGVSYDYDKRKIYPLYRAIRKNRPDVSMQDLLAANVQYCLLGDDSFYKYLLAKEDRMVLKEFKTKYEPFFIADFKWTRKNLERMKENARFFKPWYQENKAVFAQQGLLSIEDFTKNKLKINTDTQIKTPDLVHRIRDLIMAHYFRVMDGNYLLSQEKRLSDSFKKYTLGQMLIFYKMDFLPYSQFLKKKLSHDLHQQNFDEKRIVHTRQAYLDYLHMLEADYRLIHKDDVETYKEIYPVFDSFYVFYDKSPTHKENLKTAAKRALGE